MNISYRIRPAGDNQYGFTRSVSKIDKALVRKELLPSAPESVKALRCASTADAALRGLDRLLRSGWWLDMRSMRFSIENRPSRMNLRAADTVQRLGGRGESAVSILRVAASCVSFTVELTLLLKFSFQ
jgi:hypothetical protein